MPKPRRLLPALPLLLAPLLVVAPAAAQERCYGVSLASRDDGVGDAETPGASTVDYQGDAWTWTQDGACLTLPLPPQADGTPRRGAYQPLERDLP